MTTSVPADSPFGLEDLAPCTRGLAGDDSALPADLPVVAPHLCDNVRIEDAAPPRLRKRADRAGPSGLAPDRSFHSEQTVLGAVLLDNEQLVKARDAFDSLDRFADERHRLVWRAMLRMVAVGQPIDLVTLRHELERTILLEATGGVPFLAALTDGGGRLANVGAYAAMVRHQDNLEGLYRLADRIHAASMNGTRPEDLPRLAEAGGRALEGFRTVHGTAPPGGVLWQRADVRELLAAEPVAIPWLVEALLARQEVSLLVAPPKTGKSWLLDALTLDGALGRPVFGLLPVAGPLRILRADEEMGRIKLQRRLQRLARGADLTSVQVDQLALNVDLRPQQDMRLATDEGPAAFHAACARFRPDVVILDSLSGDEVVTRRELADKTTWAFYLAAEVEALQRVLLERWEHAEASRVGEVKARHRERAARAWAALVTAA